VKTVEDIKTSLHKYAEGCKELLRAGTAMYNISPSISENIWKVFSTFLTKLY
jgi:hypothetical protein